MSSPILNPVPYGYVEILRPQRSISSNTQYLTPSLKSFDELQECELSGMGHWKNA
jgi:hypothetical protein